MSDERESLPHEVAIYESHAFHAGDRAWPESNCYVDLWIEVLHAQGLEVAALFPFTFASDFEGDQWTFYKPPHLDLQRLYGIEVEELTLWQTLPAHCAQQISRGRIPMVEMDSFYLPDTEGRDYREAHAKTTIGITRIDASREELVYFHNRGLFELRDADFRGIFRIEPEADSSNLPPYCEIVKFDRLIRREPSELHDLTVELLAFHIGRRPETNPITRYAEVVDEHLAQLIDDPADLYDAYAFASIRQCGSCFAFGADSLRWLAQKDEGWATAAAAFERISSIASMLVMKMARIAYSGRLRSLDESFKEMADAWDDGMSELDRRILR